MAWYVHHIYARLCPKVFIAFSAIFASFGRIVDANIARCVLTVHTLVQVL